MTVAKHPEKFTTLRVPGPARKRLATPELPQTQGAFRMALIPTDWGTAGILWQESPRRESSFSHAPANGLLSRILTPGFPPAELRRRLVPPGHPAATEVFLPSPSRCRADLLPSWMGALVELLQATFSDTVHVANFAPRGENWAAWEPCLDFSQMTDFQRRVLAIVGRIPRGMTRTYGEVAKLAGNPNAARAVGMVMRTNPWPILIPCHRVVGAAGQMTGFSAPGGIETKRRLLGREQAK